MVALRLLEAAGVGLLAAALAAVLPLLFLMWRGQPGLAIVYILLPLGTVCGLAWAALRRPTHLDAAQEADRQLNLADLLTTAAMTPRDGGFGDAVHLMANATCARLRPRQVILNRLGMRTWGGVGLATALAMTLALLSANPLESLAKAQSDEQTRRIASARQPGQTSAMDPRSRQLPSHIASDHRPGSEDRNLDDGNPGALSKNPNGRKGADQQTTQTDGTTGGAGRSTDATPANPLDAQAASTDRRTGDGQAAGGVGVSSGARGAAGASSNLAGHSPRTAPAPPWTADSWNNSRQAAESAVRSGHVPPAYQDLVRAYFAR